MPTKPAVAVQTLALPVMMAAVLGFSFAPLAIVVGGGEDSPFLVNLLWRVGLAAGYFVYLAGFCRSLIRSPDFWSAVAARALMLRHGYNWRRISYLAIVLAVIGNFDSALFGLSTKFTDVSVIAVLFETWPIFYILITVRILNARALGYVGEEDDVDGTNTWHSLFILVLIAFAGLVFVFGSQGEYEGIGSVGNLFAWGRVPAVATVLCAALLGSFPAFSFRWGIDLGREISHIFPEESDNGSLRLCCITVATMMANLISMPFSIGIGIISGESLGLYLARYHGVIWVLILGGILAYAVPTILWRLANLMSPRNPGVNALAFLIPVFSVAWLVMFWEDVNVERWDFFVMGTAAIITANLIINFEAEIRWGFKALVLASIACGAIVYLRDDVFTALGVEPWSWTAAGYFESITLSATVFTLILAFRVARLVSRTREEQARTYNLFRRLDLLVQRGIIVADVRESILAMDKAKNDAELKAAYTDARKHISDASRKSRLGPLEGDQNDAEIQILNQAEAELDALARSKQVDLALGEIFSLVIFAGITIALALFTRPPEAGGWPRLMVDMFAMLISSVIIFLLVNVLDLNRERDEHKLENEDGEYVVWFHDTERRLPDQWVSIVVGMAILGAYAVLLAHKRLGWFF